MIVPMKKISLVVLGDKKKEVLQKLRKMGLLHIEITEGQSEELQALGEKVKTVAAALYIIEEMKCAGEKKAGKEEALALAGEIVSLKEEKAEKEKEKILLASELERLRDWGEVDPEVIGELANKGYSLSFVEMPRDEYNLLPEEVKTVILSRNKSSVKFLLVEHGEEEKTLLDSLSPYRLALPNFSTEKMREMMEDATQSLARIEERLGQLAEYRESLKMAIKVLEKEMEFETIHTGMAEESLFGERCPVSVAYFQGYIEEERVDTIKKAAADNAWGLMVEDPSKEDSVPTKLRNNKFVSLIYPLTDFLGTVPGYFEYDISGWFLAFILIFFGIIFGDGGYGLLICAVCAIPILKSLVAKKEVSPTLLLIALFGLSTVLWGTLTCTWFGLAAEKVPLWLQKLSIPPISNVYAEKIWHPFWTTGDVGLTTSQNLQIFCFSLALVQLAIAHVMGAIRNRGKWKMLGDIGSVFELIGIYYLVLNLVVNSQVFHFGVVIGGVPVGKVALGLIGVGFVLNFVFSNYEGNLLRSILTSLTNIVSVLLGVVNVFSDIVSYIRLWAVGLAGAAISATVNELAGPFFGHFLFMIIAIVLLVFGHGLNMILNVLSVIVHGIRLNTLEFSSHLDMSWSGHKFKPFKEQID